MVAAFRLAGVDGSEGATRGAVGDDRLLSRSLAALCSAYYWAGELEAGRPFGQESVERARRLGDDVQLGVSLLLYLRIIDPARSGQLVDEAIACTERSGDHLINSLLHGTAGVHALSTGDIPAARTHLEAATQAGQQIGYEDTPVMQGLGLVLRAEGDLDGARSKFETALRISRRNGDNIGMAYAILDLACLAMQATGTGQLRCTAPPRRFLTEGAISGWNWQRAIAGTSSAKRAHLGDGQLERAYAQGMALSPEKVLDLALSRAGPG